MSEDTLKKTSALKVAEETTTTQTRFKLVSRLKHPVRIKLKGGENVFIAAHGTIQNIDPELLDNDELPQGIHKVEFQA